MVESEDNDKNEVVLPVSDECELTALVREVDLHPDSSPQKQSKKPNSAEQHQKKDSDGTSVVSLSSWKPAVRKFHGSKYALLLLFHQSP